MRSGKKEALALYCTVHSRSMEHLDRENSSHQDQEACEYTLIGGTRNKLARCPSSLMSSSPNPKPYSTAASSLLSDKCPRCQLRKKRGALGSSSSAEDAAGSRSSSSLGNGGGEAILRWDEEDVMAWLRETAGLENYEVVK